MSAQSLEYVSFSLEALPAVRIVAMGGVEYLYGNSFGCETIAGTEQQREIAIPAISTYSLDVKKSPPNVSPALDDPEIRFTILVVWHHSYRNAS
jgi:hypothetical protein